MRPEEHRQAAAALWQAEQTGKQIGLLSLRYPGMTMDDAYAVLEINRNRSDKETKRAYRRMMSRHHPDKLVAKGLPEEMMKLATEKTQEIKQAYEQIKKARAN